MLRACGQGVTPRRLMRQAATAAASTSSGGASARAGAAAAAAGGVGRQQHQRLRMMAAANVRLASGLASSSSSSSSLGRPQQQQRVGGSAGGGHRNGWQGGQQQEEEAERLRRLFGRLLGLGGLAAIGGAAALMEEGDDKEEEDEEWYSREVAKRMAQSRDHKHFEGLKEKWHWLEAEEPKQDPATLPKLVVFSGSSHPMLTEEVCDYLNIPVGKSLVKRFADGEVFVRILQEIRGRDCFVIVPTNSNDNVIELLLHISTLQRASAKRITAVIPYFGYARQDQRMPFRREPIAAADIARMLEEVGVDRIVSVDLHSGQIQGFFSPRVPVDHLTPAAVAAAYFVDNIPEFRRVAHHHSGIGHGHRPRMVRGSSGRDMGDSDGRSSSSSSASSRARLLHRASTLGPRPIVTVIAPHEGQVRRARIFRERLAKMLGPHVSVDMALVSKFRDNDGRVLRQLIGDVQGRTCIIVDDLIDTGKTLATTVDLLKSEGADKVYGFATHARFSKGGQQRVQDCKDLQFIVVTNTMPLEGGQKRHIEIHPVHTKIHQLSIAPLIAEAILNIHDSGSVSSVIAPEASPERQTVIDSTPGHSDA